MRLVFGTRLSERMMPFNLTISNVPGPQMPLYLDGAEQLASYPYSTITDGMALNITVTSYNGHLDWGVVVDRDIVDDAWSMYRRHRRRPSRAARPGPRRGGTEAEAPGARRVLTPARIAAWLEPRSSSPTATAWTCSSVTGPSTTRAPRW